MSTSALTVQPTNKTARVAGALYLLASIPAGFGTLYVPRALIVRGNAAATAQNILASEMLFRLGIVSELLAAVGFIFVIRALYRLLNGVDKRLASLMVTLFLVSIPISFVNVLNQIAALSLLRGGGYLSIFDQQQREALAMLFLDLHRQGLLVAAIFWGLWLFPFGVLVMRSGFLPRILGVLLIVNGFAYPLVSLTAFLLPSYVSVVSRFALIAELGELWMIAWLLIKGAGVRRLAAAPAR